MFNRSTADSFRGRRPTDFRAGRRPFRYLRGPPQPGKGPEEPSLRNLSEFFFPFTVENGIIYLSGRKNVPYI